MQTRRARLYCLRSQIGGLAMVATDALGQELFRPHSSQTAAAVVEPLELIKRIPPTLGHLILSNQLPALPLSGRSELEPAAVPPLKARSGGTPPSANPSGTAMLKLATFPKEFSILVDAADYSVNIRTSRALAKLEVSAASLHHSPAPATIPSPPAPPLQSRRPIAQAPVSWHPLSSNKSARQNPSKFFLVIKQLRYQGPLLST